MSEKSENLLSKYRKKLHYFILGAVVAGIITGLYGGERVIGVAIIGQIFLNMLNMIVVPLIITSITSATISIGSKGNFTRLGVKTLLWYLTTSLLAILTGLVLVNLFKPGLKSTVSLPHSSEQISLKAKSTGELILRLIPSNPFKAIAEGDILPIIIFCILAGIFIAKIEGRGKQVLIDFFNGGFQLMMKITRFVLLFAPAGIFALVLKPAAEAGLKGFYSLIPYSLTVLGGLTLHSIVTLPILFLAFTRKNPVTMLMSFSPALITAFSTASSSATLPITLTQAKQEAKISDGVANFVLPLGATVNMDGTALYECVAAMFVAQLYGVKLDFFSQMIVVYTALLASIGAAGIPMAGLVMLTIVLKSVGLPLEGLALILVVDRILDMCRTTINVWSDSLGSAVIAFSEGEKDILTKTSTRSRLPSTASGN